MRVAVPRRTRIVALSLIVLLALVATLAALAGLAGLGRDDPAFGPFRWDPQATQAPPS